MIEVAKQTIITDLRLTECGREMCIPEKAVTNSSKEYHLFHYVTHGRGTFECEGKVYKVGKGMLFYIPPSVQAKYGPDREDPWTYEWLGFEGNAADHFLKLIGLTAQSPIIKDNELKTLRKFFDEVVNEYLTHGEFDIYMLGATYQMLGVLLRDNKISTPSNSIVESHIIMAKGFIENNFQFDIKIDDVASNVGVTPNYLANIFKKYENSSPKRYLIKIRMENAQKLLASGKYKIKDISSAIGYKNQLHFSAEFKKFFGKSPAKYIQGVN